MQRQGRSLLLPQDGMLFLSLNEGKKEAAMPSSRVSRVLLLEIEQVHSCCVLSF